MKITIFGAFAVGATVFLLKAKIPLTEIQFWHAFTGRHGDVVAERLGDLNADNAKYKTVPLPKGNYSETPDGKAIEFQSFSASSAASPMNLRRYSGICAVRKDRLRIKNLSSIRRC